MSVTTVITADPPESRMWKSDVCKVSPAILLVYFLISWSETFPITATTSLLVQEIGLPLPTLTTYYAVTYMPWMWKPLYGWISDTFPIAGYRRSPYIFASAVGSAFSYIAMATWVHSIPSVFILTTVQMVFSAFLQLMIGSFLVDIARRDVTQSAMLQSMANASKWLGSFAATVCALVVYAHGADGGLQGRGGLLTARQAIAATAVAPILIALSVPFLRESREASVDSFARAHSSWCHSRRRSPGTKRSGARFALVVAVVQANLVVVGCQSMMTLANWELALSVCATVSFVVLGCLFCSRQFADGSSGTNLLPDQLEVEDERRRGRRWARTAIFCFLVNAIPTSSVSLNLLQFTVLTEESYQTLGLISSLSSLCASLVFGMGCHRRSIIHAVVASTVLAVFAGLATLPFVLSAANASGKHALWSHVGGLCVVASIVSSAASVFIVLPIDTLVTTACGLDVSARSSTGLAVFLSSYSFGGTVSGLASAPLLAALGLDGKHWQALPAWILITSFAKLLIIFCLPLIPLSARQRVDHQEPQAEVVEQACMTRPLSSA